jgi:hypothetical protein
MTMPRAIRTVAHLHNTLTDHHPDSDVVYDDGTPVGEPTSWRGDYTELALDRDTGDIPRRTVGSLVTELGLAAAGGTFNGYKGGTYTMRPTTPVWVSRYGHADSGVITHVTADGGRVVLHCIDIDPL